MKKAFITGITGFAGSFLAEYLLEVGGYGVSGTYLTDGSLVNISKVKNKLRLYKVDLQDRKATGEIIHTGKPDLVFHLAALTAPGESFDNPSEFITNNISVEVNLLEAIRKTETLPNTLIVSSAEVYGNVNPLALPIDEETELRPVNPYAVSKVACDFLGLQYFFSYKIPVIRVRPFNHIGPRQSSSFVVSSFAKKIAEIERNSANVSMKVGNLSAKRDFTDVRDIVRGYVDLLKKGKVGDVYNIGSGRSYEIKYILDTLLSFSDKKITVEMDPELVRPVDVPELVCDNAKIKREIGWEPRIPIEQTLRETLDYWRSII